MATLGSPLSIGSRLATEAPAGAAAAATGAVMTSASAVTTAAALDQTTPAVLTHIPARRRLRDGCGEVRVCEVTSSPGVAMPVTVCGDGVAASKLSGSRRPAAGRTPGVSSPVVHLGCPTDWCWGNLWGVPSFSCVLNTVEMLCADLMCKYRLSSLQDVEAPDKIDDRPMVGQPITAR
jgi:hypothetical protein